MQHKYTQVYLKMYNVTQVKTMFSTNLTVIKDIQLFGDIIIKLHNIQTQMQIRI